MEAVQMGVSMSTATEVREPKVQESVKVRRPPRVLPSSIPVPESPLFADVLLEESSLQRRRRTLATVLSIFFQSLLVGSLLLVPLMYTETLPRQQLLSFLIAPPPPRLRPHHPLRPQQPSRSWSAWELTLWMAVYARPEGFRRRCR